VETRGWDEMNVDGEGVGGGGCGQEDRRTLVRTREYDFRKDDDGGKQQVMKYRRQKKIIS
jgi:hypothetical protein